MRGAGSISRRAAAGDAAACHHWPVCDELFPAPDLHLVLVDLPGARGYQSIRNWFRFAADEKGTR